MFGVGQRIWSGDLDNLHTSAGFEELEMRAIEGAADGLVWVRV